MPPARVACCPLPFAEKVTIIRAPPARPSSCSQMLSERAVRVHVAAEEDPERERRRQSAVARSDDDMVDVVVCRTVRGRARPVQRSIVYV